MKLTNLLVSGCLSAAMAAFPAVAAISQARGCPAGKVTPASYTWNFQQETDGIFQDIQADAQQASYRATLLQSIADNPQLSWDSNANELMHLRSLINDMGQKMCRLQTIRRVDTRWQKTTIDRMAKTLRLMADNAQDAIVFGNRHQNDLWLATYRKYADNLYDQAHSLTQTVDHAVEYANVQTQDQNLRKDLGVKASS